MSTDSAEGTSTSVRGPIGAADVAADEEDWNRTEEILLEALSRTRRRKAEALRNDSNE